MILEDEIMIGALKSRTVRCLNLGAVCQLCQLPRRTLYRMIGRGEFPRSSHKWGREVWWHEDDVTAYQRYGRAGAAKLTPDEREQLDRAESAITADVRDLKKVASETPVANGTGHDVAVLALIRADWDLCDTTPAEVAAFFYHLRLRHSKLLVEDAIHQHQILELRNDLTRQRAEHVTQE